MQTPVIPPPSKNNVWYTDDDSDDVIVFVHGILSDSNGCWVNQNGAADTYWPELVRQDKQLSGYSIFLGGFYTGVGAANYDIRPSSDELFGALNRSRDNERPVMTRRRILFVCHSLGGVVTRYMLETNFTRFSDKCIGLLLIASPSYGSKWANRFGLLSSFYKNELGMRLKWGDWSLQDLDDRFKSLIARRLIPNLVGQEAYENHFVVKRKWLPDRSKVVTKESAGRYFGPPILLRGTDHFSCVKPDGVDHPAHELLRDFSKQFLAYSPERSQAAALSGSGPSSDPAPAASDSTPSPQTTSPTRRATTVPEMLRQEKWESIGRFSLLTLIGVLLLTGAASTFTGYRLGRSYSIDYTKPDSLPLFLLTSASWRFIDDSTSELTVVVDDTHYAFRSGETSIQRRKSVPSDVLDMFRTDDRLSVVAVAKWFRGPETKYFATAAASGGVLAALGTAGRLARRQSQLLGAVGMAAGGAVGFSFGLVDIGSPNDPRFREWLVRDIELWSGMNRRYSELCGYIASYRDLEERFSRDVANGKLKNLSTSESDRDVTLRSLESQLRTIQVGEHWKQQLIDSPAGRDLYFQCIKRPAPNIWQGFEEDKDRPRKPG